MRDATTYTDHPKDNSPDREPGSFQGSGLFQGYGFFQGTDLFPGTGFLQRTGVWLGVLFLTALLGGCGDDAGAFDNSNGCFSNDDCGSTLVCQNGVCVEPVCDCPAIYDPVCGEDGMTWDNQCEADCAGVTVARRGECERLCTGDQECPAGQRCTAGEEECLPDPSCTDAGCDAVCYGRCIMDTCPCPDTYDPVCGIDGTTWDNECLASCEGVTVAYAGECGNMCPTELCAEPCPAGWMLDPSDCASCECIPIICQNTADCPEGTVCDPEACVPSCPACADCNPSCVPEMPTCVCPDGDPVCGVDGNTWPSACEAECQGVEVAHQGACSPQLCPELADCDLQCEWGLATDMMGCPICQCFDGARTLCSDTRDCGAGEWCNPSACAPSCAGCDDCQPACQREACTCPALWDPVCDESGWTWANVCEAQCAGVTSVRRGTCGSDCVCGNEYEPVCGTDGVTYANPCLANCAEVQVVSDGTCP